MLCESSCCSTSHITVLVSSPGVPFTYSSEQLFIWCFQHFKNKGTQIQALNDSLMSHTVGNPGLKARSFCNMSCFFPGPQNNTDFLINNTQSGWCKSSLLCYSVLSLSNHLMPWNLFPLCVQGQSVACSHPGGPRSAPFCAGCSHADRHRLWVTDPTSPPVCSKLRNILAENKKIALN